MHRHTRGIRPHILSIARNPRGNAARSGGYPPALALASLLLMTAAGPLASAGPKAPVQAEPRAERGSATLQAAGLELQGKVSTSEVLTFTFEVRLTQPAGLELRCTDGGGLEQHLLQSAPAMRHQLTLRGVKPATTYSCQARSLSGGLSSNTISLTSATLPSSLYLPKITVPSNDVVRTGYTLYNYASGGFGSSDHYLVIVDARGNVRWYLQGSKINDLGGSDTDASWLGNDTILYGGDSDSHTLPTMVGLDGRVRFRGAVGEPVSAYDVPDHPSHDCGISQDGNSIFYINDANLAGVGSVDPALPFVWGFVIKQLDPATNTLLWHWDSVEDGFMTGILPDPGAPYSSEEYFPADPYHANSIVDQWENGRLYLYLNMRDNNTILKLDYETKDLVWRLGVDGDFTLLEKDGTPAQDARWFFNAHDVQVRGNLVTIYDNGQDRPQYGGTAYSRVVQLSVDEETGEARLVGEYSETGWSAGFFGGYEVRSDGYGLVAMYNAPSARKTGVNSALLELDPAQKVVWRAELTRASDSVYRARHIGGCDIFHNLQYCPAGTFRP